MDKTDVKLLLQDLRILESYEITKEEINHFPAGTVYETDGKYFHWSESELTEEYIKIAIMAKQTHYLRTIRNVVIFFFIASLLGFILLFI